VGCVGLGLDVTCQRNLGDVLGGELHDARQKLEALVERIGVLAPEHRALVEEVLESSFTAIEELQVTGEELHQQNEELIAMHNELETSRRRYRDLFQSAPDGYLVTDPAGIIHRANQAAEEVRTAAEEALAANCTLLAGAAPVRDEQGGVISGVTVFQDISDLRETERALRESEARYRELFATSRDGLVFTDMEGRFLQCNPAYLDLLGYESLEELCGKPYEELTPPEYHALEARIVQEQTLPRGYSDAYEKEYIRKTGERIPVSVKGWLRVDDDGEPVGMWVIVRDITKRKQAEDALQRERNLLRTIMENTHAQLAYLNVNFDFLIVNAAYTEGAGYSEEELVGRNHFELFPHAENQAIFERVRDTGEAVAFQARPFEFPDQPERGTTYWDWTLVPVKENGRVSGLVFSLLDVTEQERARRALRLSAERLRGLYRTSRAILTAHSLDDIATATLRRVPDLLDCVRADIMLYDFEADTMTLLAVHIAGETDVDEGWGASIDASWVNALQVSPDEVHFIADLQQTPPTSAWQAALQAEQVRALLALPLYIDGTLVGSLNLGMGEPGPVLPDKIEIAQELATQLTLGIQQIKLREQVQRHAEELEEKVRRRTAALRAINTRFRVIFEDAAIGIALIDQHTRVIASNPSLHDMLGYSAEELKGMALTQLSHPDILANDAQLYRELLDGKRRHYQVEGRYVHKEGHPIDVNVVVSLVQQQHTTNSRYAIVMIEDISEKKAAQTALIQSEKLALTGQLAASLAHEINNPLQSVVGFLSLIEESPASDSEMRRHVRIAIAEIKRAASLVRQLRNINHPTQGEEKQGSDVNALIEQMLSLSRKKCGDQGVEIVWEPAGEVSPILAISNRLQQVFLNLVLNALDAMPEGGTLHISTARTESPAGVEIRFADTGEGIPGDQIPNLFKPFYTTKDTGLGLGLYISDEIIQTHNGHIAVESEVGEGTTFTVWLPAATG